MQFRTASTLLTICLIALVFDGTDATPTRPDNSPRQGGWLGNHRAYGQRIKELEATGSQDRELVDRELVDREAEREAERRKSQNRDRVALLAGVVEADALAPQRRQLFALEAKNREARFLENQKRGAEARNAEALEAQNRKAEALESQNREMQDVEAEALDAEALELRALKLIAFDVAAQKSKDLEARKNEAREVEYQKFKDLQAEIRRAKAQKLIDLEARILKASEDEVLKAEALKIEALEEEAIASQRRQSIALEVKDRAAAVLEDHEIDAAARNREARNREAEVMKGEALFPPTLANSRNDNLQPRFSFSSYREPQPSAVNFQHSQSASAIRRQLDVDLVGSQNDNLNVASNILIDNSVNEISTGTLLDKTDITLLIAQKAFNEKFQKQLAAAQDQAMQGDSTSDDGWFEDDESNDKSLIDLPSTSSARIIRHNGQNAQGASPSFQDWNGRTERSARQVDPNEFENMARDENRDSVGSFVETEDNEETRRRVFPDYRNHPTSNTDDFDDQLESEQVIGVDAVTHPSIVVREIGDDSLDAVKEDLDYENENGVDERFPTMTGDRERGQRRDISPESFTEPIGGEREMTSNDEFDGLTRRITRMPNDEQLQSSRRNDNDVQGVENEGQYADVSRNNLGIEEFDAHVGATSSTARLQEQNVRPVHSEDVDVMFDGWSHSK